MSKVSTTGAALGSLARRPARVVRRAAGGLKSFVGRRPGWALSVLGAVTVVLVAGAVTAWFMHARASAVEAARTQAADSAKQSVTTLLSYDYASIDNAAKARADLLTGKFKDDYARLVTDTVAPAAKSRKLVTRTTVAADSVISADRHQVALLMFLNQESQADGAAQPIYTGSRVRVTVQQVDGTWRVAEMTPL